MSQENVDLVRRGYEALNQGDFQTLLAMFDPHVQVRLAHDAGQVLGPDFEPTYEGLDGFMRFMGQLMEAWEQVAWHAEEVRDAGGDRVVVPAGSAHGLLSSGKEPLRLVSAQPSDHVVQEWLED